MNNQQTPEPSDKPENPQQYKAKIRRVHLQKSLLISASISSLALAACQASKEKTAFRDNTNQTAKNLHKK